VILNLKTNNKKFLNQLKQTLLFKMD
jgi:hypothetical protein